MKKYLSLLILSFFILSSLVLMASFKEEKTDDYFLFLQGTNFSSEEIDYIYNNINYDDLLPYLDYQTFNPYLFYEYEKVRIENNFTYLKALNTINNPHYYDFYLSPQNVIFKDSYLMLVNKCFYLDSSFIPNDLVCLKDTNINYIKREDEIMQGDKTMLAHFDSLIKDAKKEGYDLWVFSCYRSFEKQLYLYYEVNNQNDKTVARAGFSEHQTGLSIDVSTKQYGLTNYFKESDEYKWLIENAHKYGFILRYPEGKENITGYSYESWHFRFVGVEYATIIYNQGITLEEYLLDNWEIK